MPTTIARRLSAAAALVAVAAMAGPAGTVELENTAWETSGRSIAKVKGIGKAKGDAEVTLTFFIASFVRAEDAFQRELTGTYAMKGRKGRKADLLLDTESTATLERVIETQIEDAVLRRASRVTDVDVDVMTVRARAGFNGNGTKVRFKLKAKAFGTADLDPRPRRTTYTVRTKGERTF